MGKSAKKPNVHASEYRNYCASIIVQRNLRELLHTTSFAAFESRASTILNALPPVIASTIPDEQTADLSRRFTTLLNNISNWNQANRLVHDLARAIQQHLRIVRRQSIVADHQGKRKVVRILQLKKPPMSLRSMFKANMYNFSATSAQVKREYGIDLIHRQRCRNNNGYKRYRPLVEVLHDDTPSRAIHVSAETGFYILGPAQSAVFVSLHDDEENSGAVKLVVELVIIRNVPGDEAFAAKLFEWLTYEIYVACRNRRNIRPTHPGRMAQIGLTMGARHAPVLGWAKSFVTRLGDEEKERQDNALIGAMSLTWALVKAFMPSDVTEPVQELLDAGYPRLASRNVPEGTGFSIYHNGVEYNFSTNERAPPEGFVTHGYEAWSHPDNTATGWGYGWTTSRECPNGSDLSDGCGAAFVDLGVKVCVQAAVGTMTAYRPNALHGTTPGGGWINSGICPHSTGKVKKAYEKLAKEGKSIGFSKLVDRHDDIDN